MNEPAESDADNLLVNDLSIGDARNLLRVEGGELTQSDVIFQLASIVLVSGSVAWAIATGRVTIWHMTLPMVGEYLGYLIAVPVMQVFVRHSELRVTARSCVRNLVIIGIAIVVALLGWAWESERGLIESTSEALFAVWKWITGSGMHWPLLIAMISAGISVKRYVDRLIESGPPFGATGWGCAVRIIVFLIAGFLVLIFSPILLAGSDDVWARAQMVTESVGCVWALWALILISQLLALWIHRDIQQRLKQAAKSTEPIAESEL